MGCGGWGGGHFLALELYRVLSQEAFSQGGDCLSLSRDLLPAKFASSFPSPPPPFPASAPTRGGVPKRVPAWIPENRQTRTPPPVRFPCPHSQTWRAPEKAKDSWRLILHLGSKPGENNSKPEPAAPSSVPNGSRVARRAHTEPGAQSWSPEKAHCPFKRPRISRPAFLPGAPAVIDAGRREEAPGANKSPARGRAAPGRQSPQARGIRNKWPPLPPQGSRGRAGAPQGGGRARQPGRPRGSAPTSGARWADGDPVAAARRASGRPPGAGSRWRCARRPRTRILSGGAPPGALGGWGARSGDRAPPPTGVQEPSPAREPRAMRS